MDEPAERDPGLVRVSDAERQQVADLLRDAAAEGRLELDELEERLEAVYGARVAADLVPLVADLPTTPRQDRAPAPRPTPTGPLARHSTSLAVMGGRERRGAWEVGELHTAVVLMGGADIDLREARFTAPETVITAVAVMGGIDITVGPEVRLSVEGLGIMGGFGEATPQVEAQLGPDSPVVRVRGLALMGGVDVHRKARRLPPSGQERPELR